MATNAGLGKVMLIKVKTGGTDVSPVFTKIGGMQTKSLKINGQPVDITNDDSSGFEEYLAGAGIVSVSISGEVVLVNEAPMQLLVTKALALGSEKFQVITHLGDFEGTFLVESFEISGTTKAEQRASISLKNAGGAITYTAAVIV